jgi:hypothetical protein
MQYDDAVASLFQVPVDQFVAERKRLAGELKAAGDKEGAARLAKLARPPISAWVVNQLWWHARADFETIFETARRLRAGAREAMGAHREAIAKLRAQAARILTDAEHGATEATLRRVTQTLSALAAAGGWEPDLPGALSADRDPPGFEAIGISHAITLPVSLASRTASKPETADLAATGAAPALNEPDDGYDDGDEDDAARVRREAEASARAEAAARAEATAALRRAEAERAKVAAERHRVEAALRTAQGDVAQREREVAKLERDLAAARSMVAQARSVVAGLEERLAQFDN